MRDIETLLTLFISKLEQFNKDDVLTVDEFISVAKECSEDLENIKNNTVPATEIRFVTELLGDFELPDEDSNCTCYPPLEEEVEHWNGLIERPDCFYYRGNNVKKFLKKYKEFDPDSYPRPEDVVTVHVKGTNYVGMYK